MGRDGKGSHQLYWYVVSGLIGSADRGERVEGSLKIHVGL